MTSAEWVADLFGVLGLAVGILALVSARGAARKAESAQADAAAALALANELRGE